MRDEEDAEVSTMNNDSWNNVATATYVTEIVCVLDGYTV